MSTAISVDVAVDSRSTLYRYLIDTRSTVNWPKLNLRLVYLKLFPRDAYCSSIGGVLAKCRSSVGEVSAKCRPSIGEVSVT